MAIFLENRRIGGPLVGSISLLMDRFQTFIALVVLLCLGVIWGQEGGVTITQLKTNKSIQVEVVDIQNGVLEFKTTSGGPFKVNITDLTQDSIERLRAHWATRGTTAHPTADDMPASAADDTELVEGAPTTDFFPIAQSSSLSSPYYFVVRADAVFSPPVNLRDNWVLDLGRSKAEPTRVNFPIKVAKGVQRIVSSTTGKRIVVFGAEDFDLLKRVASLEFYGKLKLQERRALMAVLSSDALEHGRASRAAVRDLILTDSFAALKSRDQEEQFLKAVEKSSPNLNRNFQLTTFQETETKERWRRHARYTTFQIEEPTEAWENEVNVKGAGRVQIMSLKENDETGLKAMAQALAALPPEMVEYLEVVSLHYKGDGFWWGGGSSIYYVAPRDLQYDGPLVYVVAHEVGHCIQAQKVKGDWNEALQNCVSFPSAYGLTNVNEDFAEFASIMTRAWTKPQEIIEIEEVFPWRFEIYAKALKYNRSKSKDAQ